MTDKIVERMKRAYINAHRKSRSQEIVDESNNMNRQEAKKERERHA